jgi:hypothetical protein
LHVLERRWKAVAIVRKRSGKNSKPQPLSA